MATTLETFLPYVTPNVLGCPEPLALAALRLTCIDFCRRTNAVQRIQAPLDAEEETQEYTVSVPTDMELCRVLGVAWKQYWLTPVPPEQARNGPLLLGEALSDIEPLRGFPRYYFMKSPTAARISVYPIPDELYIESLVIQASFMPSMTATEVDDSLFSQWCEGIAAGAVDRLKSTPGQPYSAASLQDRAIYERAVNEARRNQIFGRVTSLARISPRSFV